MNYLPRIFLALGADNLANGKTETPRFRNKIVRLRTEPFTCAQSSIWSCVTGSDGLGVWCKLVLYRTWPETCSRSSFSDKLSTSGPNQGLNTPITCRPTMRISCR